METKMNCIAVRARNRLTSVPAHAWGDTDTWGRTHDVANRMKQRREQYCTALYCTVLYCTVLYCTVQRGPGRGSCSSCWRTATHTRAHTRTRTRA